MFLMCLYRLGDCMLKVLPSDSFCYGQALVEILLCIFRKVPGGLETMLSTELLSLSHLV